MKPSYNLCFSGSGDKLFTQIGTWEILENWIKPEQIVVTSGGSLCGSFVALDYTFYSINKLIKELKLNELIDTYWNKPFSLLQEDKLALIEGKKLYNKLKEIFPYKLKDARYPIAFVTTEVDTNKMKIFGTYETPDIWFYDAIRATISLPLIFTPHIINGKKYCDGGLCENFYLKYFEGKENIIGIRCIDKEANEPVKNIQSLITKTLFIPIIKNEEKNIEDCPKAKILNLITESDNYDFKKLDYSEIMKQMQYGENQAIKFINNNAL